MNVDFALLRRQNPIPAYLKRHGVKVAYPKFSCVNPDHADRNPSASIYDGDEKWMCHGCEKHGDVVDLEMLRTGCDRPEAIARLGGESWQGPLREPPPKGSKPQLVRDFGTPPEDAPKLSPPHISLRTKAGNTKRWTIDHLYEYRDSKGVLQAYVARLDHDEETGGKRIFPVRWHLTEKAWMQAGYQKNEPRPLFNEHKLAERTQAEVLVVEGEKAARIAEALFDDMVVISWMGGDKNASNSDYSLLKGRHVTLWRDNDAVGLEAIDVVARKAQASTLLTVPMGKDWLEGWDIVDIAKEPGAAREALERRKPYKFDISPKGKAGAWAKIEDGGWLPDHIRPIPGPNGQVKTTSGANAYVALLHHPLFATLGWDILAKQIVWNGNPVSAGRLHFLQLHLNEVTGLDVNQGFDKIVESVAIERPINRLAEQIKATPWDASVSRIDRLWTYLGVEQSDWAVAGLKRWFLGHVKRVLEPGWKQDLILVLEGEQGMGKSSALKILGLAFGFPGYARLASLGGGRMNDNDMQAIAGQTLIELGEMTAHRKADLDHFKDITTRDEDRYRAPYTKDWLTVPRTASFAGTTNLKSDWLNDPTGGRRFVPVRCDLAIDLAGLQADREQLYAEAWHLLQAGEQTWFTPEEEALQEVEVAARQTVSYFKARMTEIVESLHGDFLREGDMWDSLGVPASSARERNSNFPHVKTAMLELGWDYQRQTIETGQRVWGFTNAKRKPGRRWYKQTLTPP